MSRLGDALSAIREYTPEPETQEIAERARDVFSRLRRERRSRRGTISAQTSRSQREVGHVDPPRDDLAKYWDQKENNPVIGAPIEQFDDDVLADGWRIEADDEETQKFATEWCKECGIVYGETDEDLIEVVSEINQQFDAKGNVAVEKVPAAEDRDVIAAIKLVPIDTLSYKTRPNSSVLLQPDDVEHFPNAPSTDHDTAAAYVQYDPQGNGSWPDQDPNYLDNDQIVRYVKNSEPGSLTGEGDVAPISQRAEKFKEKMLNNELSIESMAWGQWFFGFEPMVIETEDGGTEIIEFDDQSMNEFEKKVEGLKPGAQITHDGKINVQNVPGEVADILGYLEFDVEYILSSLPAPKYLVGWADNINRDITTEQKEAHEQDKQTRRRLHSRKLTPIVREVCEQEGYDPEGLRLVFEPEPDESPVMSLSTDETERVLNLSKALKNVAGSGEPTTLIEEDALLSLLLQLPEDVALPADANKAAQAAAAVDEDDPQVREQHRRLQERMDAVRAEHQGGGPETPADPDGDESGQQDPDEAESHEDEDGS